MTEVNVSEGHSVGLLELKMPVGEFVRGTGRARNQCAAYKVSAQYVRPTLEIQKSCLDLPHIMVHQFEPLTFPKSM